MMKKIFIALVAALFIAIIIAVTLVLAILNWPTTLINPTALLMASRHLAPLGIRIEWEQARTRSISHGAFDETFTIGFDNLCASVKPTLEKACFSHIEASVRYRFRALMPEVVAIGPVVVEASDVRIHPSDEKKTEKPEGILPIPEIKLPEIVTKAQFFPIDVKIDSLVVGADNSELTAKIEVHAKPDTVGRLESVSAQVEATAGSGEHLELTANASSASFFTAGDWKLTANAKAGLGSAVSATLEATLDTQDGKQIQHDVKATYAKGTLHAEAALAGTISEERLSTKLGGALTGVSEFTPRIAFAGCNLELTSTDRHKNRGDLALACPVDITIKKFDLPHDVDPIYQQPRNIYVDIQAQADTFFFPDLDQRTKASLAVTLKPQKNKLVRMHGNLKVDYDGVFSQPANTWKVKSNADVDFTIDRFAKLVKVLSGTKWPVPAPINVLQGSIEFSIEGSMSSQSGEAVFPAKLSTKLESEKQRIFIESNGKLEMGMKGTEVGDMNLDLDVALTDVQLQLPSISMAGIPRLTPDSRIVLNPKKQEEKEPSSKTPSFDYAITVKTPEESPVRILSNLTPTFVPIALDLLLKPGDMSGTISVTEFPVKLFSQTATIDNLDLTLREPTETSEVIGRLSIPYIDMTILIELAGTIEQPSITLASNPPMSQGDIISMLLYGEPMDALDSDDASSATNMNAALANNAVALTSFFLLASTPIQSVGYNPETQMFSARIKLAKKTSLTVGSSNTTKEVGIKQRLGKGWSITTGWEKDNDSSSSAGGASAYIEWSKRY
jgi:hypothetical protein